MMEDYKYLHILQNEKFIASFIEFINKHCIMEDHLFIILEIPEKKYVIPRYNNIIILNATYSKRYGIIKLSKQLNPYFAKAQKVIIHSLLIPNIIPYLYLHQKYLEKCFLTLWGADLYIYNKPKVTLQSKIWHYMRSRVYANMGHLITYIKGDYELAQKWYGAKGVHVKCSMYPSNLYKEYDIKAKQHNTLNILVGNSADMSNEHFDIFNKLKKYIDDDIKIITPLSYGDQVYAKEVITQGRKIFGNKFHPIVDFMPLDKYLALLADIDIAIFNHNRQQGMGNIITLLGLGKKVYIRKNITSWEMFEDLEIKVFDIDKLTTEPISDKTKSNNLKMIQKYFSEEINIKHLKNLFRS